MTQTNALLRDQFDHASQAVAYIRTLSPLTPRVAIVLGSGLGEFAAEVRNPVTVPYRTIPHFPQSTVEGHSGNLILGTIAGIPVAVMQGRVHAYEGYSMSQVTFPIRVLGLLGITTIIVTNAAGGVNPNYTTGTLVVISDHINFTGNNAAIGPNEPRFGMLPPLPGQSPRSGLRFFDMTNAYSPALRNLAIATAAARGYILTEGTYVAVLGPSYETPAEIRAFRRLGADLVGMSTVHEVIVARHMGIEVLGISLVTNPAAGVSPEAINHEEVMDVGRQVEGRFCDLLTAIIPVLGSIAI